MSEINPASATQIGAALLNIEDIRPSAENPRRHFDDAALKELSDSIRIHGVLQPLLVRVAPGDADGDAYEIVAGERRYRAACEAGLTHVPAIVRVMTHQEATEARLIENVQRADLTALEEGLGYRTLQEHHNLSVAQICERTGKARATVYGRLALTRMDTTVLQALQKGEIDTSTAELIARIPAAEDQKEALESIKDDRMSFREAKEFIGRTFLIDLNHAPFDTGEEGMLPGAVSCEKCPRRSGNCREEYPDIKSKNICVDPACYRIKLAAHANRTRESLAKKGEKVLSDEETRKLYRWEGSDHVDSSSGFVASKDTCYQAKKQASYGQLLKDCDVKPVWAVRHETGEAVMLYPAKEASAALVKAGKMRPEAVSGGRNASKEERAAVIARNKIEKATLENVAFQMRAQCTAMPEEKFWGAILSVLIGWKHQKVWAAASGDKLVPTADTFGALEPDALRLIALQMVVCDHHGGHDRWQMEKLAPFKVDWNAAAALAEKHADTPKPKLEKEPAAAPKKAGKKGGRK